MAETTHVTSPEDRNLVEEDSIEAGEFDAILEQAAPTISEMARQAREMRRAGQTRKFPA